MGALVPRINEQQLSFAREYVLGDTPGNGAQSAVRAGYEAACARQTACRLLQHDGVRVEIEKLTRQALGDHASAAVALLGRVVRDEKAPLKIRVDACKTILDRAGYVPPRAPDAPAPPLDAMDYNKMPLDKLLRMLAAQEEKVAAMERDMIDVTPDAQPDAQEEGEAGPGGLLTG